MALICLKNSHRSSRKQFKQGVALGARIPTQIFFIFPLEDGCDGSLVHIPNYRHRKKGHKYLTFEKELIYWKSNFMN